MRWIPVGLRTGLWALVVLICAGTGWTAESRQVVVGTKEAPPFAMRGSDGSWHGISIALWEAVAEELGLEFSYRAYDLPGLLQAVKTAEVDVAVAALTVTAEREEVLDFVHPFYTSGLGIAVRTGSGSNWLGMLGRVFSPAFLKTLAALSLLLLLVGFLVWLFERRANPEQFGGGTARGIGAGFWWSAVTMTTVGYGDKAPVTILGRLVALVWMFAAIIVISGFTAAITSALTVSRLEGTVRGPEDLPRVVVGSVPGSTSSAYLERRGLSFRSHPSPRETLTSLAHGKVDAVVYDAPMLRYLTRSQFGDALKVLPFNLERQDYAFALPAGSPLRESVTRAVLAQLDAPSWQQTLTRYLGP